MLWTHISVYGLFVPGNCSGTTCFGHGNLHCETVFMT